ncbi:hypothetical protein LTR36_000940 [Oleoguttula mirabilis]|uniref:ERCC1-like central domain-containing protein n=1 Tax=Oleoguttula mirabilis TaxID=1507867 RepID=A0AAV9JPP1_9PEZI|nr:hypothetical protein LTR36_000940 [Oleoguttula mirabilis]
MADGIQDDFTSIPRPATNGPTGASASTSRPNAAASGPKATAAFDRGNATEPKKSGVVQPKPQALPKRAGPSSIIVSPRQKGNPILANIKSMPWEYGDIPADYVLGLTTCALFLSLKYHRLHPEYIYTRIKNLQGKYNLRVVLVMVDIQNHEETLRELSKTSLINHVTLILCWSAAEGGRYLELFKTFENAAPTSIKQHQSTNYSARMVDFVTTPRSINKTDAVSLVSQFGTLRTAVNARHEDVATIAGWGEKKVQRWCAAVREPFRIRRAARRGLGREDTAASQAVLASRAPTLSRDVTRGESDLLRPGSADGADPLHQSNTIASSGLAATALADSDADRRPRSRLAEELPISNTYYNDDDDDDEAAMVEALTAAPVPPKKAMGESARVEASRKRKPDDDDPLSEGIMTALSKLRKS